MISTDHELYSTDKAYRTAVFDLESYRLNINKIVMHANEVSLSEKFITIPQHSYFVQCRL